ncbi:MULTISPECIES: hypothetical protein [Bradyrhizobium]|uniref:Uncharacterized protein n=1 Tax=Bradyrhizobium vignae TaxID=1549949 RepID=A0A2U3Q726_9BRAD|nr:hypothetical protein [Bradyrhizobium vignae]MBP0116539.1 hypothetical protein [Bradyrhizobium vignae]SPP97231.1 conserved membrane protein of unknown function [Bradyrhizobium vignae]
MTEAAERSRLLYWAGVALGPIAWGLNLQGVYVLAHFSCEGTRMSGAILSGVLAIVALVGTFISARAVRRSAGAEWSDARGGGPRSFMAWIGVRMGVLFALVIANQLAASLLISPCLR